ncbi:hypothetical protein APUTEX25_000842 [Auxenochlorella protothecoides]|uniref:peptidylprolyl isomerase n=1 Tax=Auxenochlorella protothecoides TaxID=3075 RepID=A0A3M7KQB1_AUXPR|nr:hypothetical protein APUTEX25_000842 [Auxenochlorella protothecoides]|eukprot:RMZ52723.1 hypothetical protein APUTEX25_000842 [Auxenochlorella protothecoides]
MRCAGDLALEDEFAEAVDEVGKEIDVSKDGGVRKIIKKVGAGYEVPEKGDKVTVHYTGTLEDGTKFDSSRDRDDPFTFTLGQGQVIKGWDLSVATMKKGESATVIIRGDYGYGAAGSPPKIPANATLHFDIELLSWRSDKDLTGDGGVIKTILAEGKGWANPGKDDVITLELKATSLEGTDTVYTSPEGGYQVTLASGGADAPFFCRALEVALPKMKKGERATLVVKPQYGPVQGPGAGEALEIEVTLVDWQKVERLPGGVVKRTLVSTDEWQTPNEGATVTLAYTARLAVDGTVFDERTTESPLVVETDADALPEGLEAAVMKMKKGEKCVVMVPAALAYGSEGSDQPMARVPADVDVEYEVTLVDQKQAKGSWEMSTPEKIAAAIARKEKGNAYFKAGRVGRAVRQWNQAEEIIKYDDAFSAEEKEESRAVKKSVQLNLAAAHLKEGSWTEARKAATSVLDHDSFNLKALFRRAQAYLGTFDFVEAEQDIKKGLGVDPNNADFNALHRKWKVAQAAAGKAEAKLYSKMFAPRPSAARPQAAEAAPAAEVAPAPEPIAAV